MIVFLKPLSFKLKIFLLDLLLLFLLLQKAGGNTMKLALQTEELNREKREKRQLEEKLKEVQLKEEMERKLRNNNCLLAPICQTKCQNCHCIVSMLLCASFNSPCFGPHVGYRQKNNGGRTWRQRFRSCSCR